MSEQVFDGDYQVRVYSSDRVNKPLPAAINIDGMFFMYVHAVEVKKAEKQRFS